MTVTVTVCVDQRKNVKRANVFSSVSSTLFQANSEHFLKIIIQDCECSNDDMCDNDKICKDDCYCLPRGNGKIIS